MTAHISQNAKAGMHTSLETSPAARPAKSSRAVRLSLGAALLASSAMVPLHAQTFDIGGGTLVVSDISGPPLNSATEITNGTLTINTEAVLAPYTGILSDSLGVFRLNKAGGGTVTLSGNNTYTGVTNVQAGTLIAASSTALGTTAGGTVVSSGATLGLQGGITIGEPITLNGSGVGGNGALRNVTGINRTTGAITLGSASTIGSDAGILQIDGTINNNGHLLTSTGSGRKVFVGAISGTGGFTKTGSGQTDLNGVNTYAGTTTVESGILLLNGGSAINDLGRVVVNGGAFGIFNDETIGSLEGTGGFVSVSTGSGVTRLTVGGNNLSTSYTGNIRDNGGGLFALGKIGTGTLTLTSASTYSGGTTINNGTIVAGNSTALGSGSVFLGGTGTKLVADFDGTLLNRVAVGSGSDATFAATTGRTATLTSFGLGSGATVRFGSAAEAGTIVWDVGALGVSSAITPSVVVDGGTLRLGSTAAGAASFFALMSAIGSFEIAQTGTLDTSGNSVTLRQLAGLGTIANSGLANTLTLSNAQGFAGTLDSGANGITLAGSLAGFGPLTKRGAGTLTLAPGLTTTGYTGGLTLAQGTLSLQGNLASTFGTITTTGSVIDYGNGVTIAAPIAINSNTTQLQVLTGSATQSGVISDIGGARGFEKIGAGRLTLSGANTYGGVTTVSAGTLRAADAAALGSNAVGTTVADGATLEFLGNTAFSEPLDITGNGVSNGGAIRIVSDAPSLNGAITLSGDARINSDSAGDAVTSFPAFTTGAITGIGRNLTLGGSGILAITGAINLGTGTLIKDGSGGVALAATNTFGAVTLNSGLLQLSGGAAVTDSATITINGGDLLVSASETIGGLAGSASGAVFIDPSQTLTVGANNLSTTFAGRIESSGSLVKAGTGTLTLTGSNTYSGGTTISDGTLVLDNVVANSIGAAGSGTITFAGNGTLQSNVTGVLDNIIAIAPGVSATIGAAAGQTLSLAPSFFTHGAAPGTTLTFGSSALTGTVELGITGGIAINGQETFALAGGTLRSVTSNSVNLLANHRTAVIGTGAATATLDLNGRNQLLNNLQGNTSGRILNDGSQEALLTLVGTGTNTFAGTIANGASPLDLRIAMGGTQILTGNNSYRDTTITAGTLQIGDGGTSGTLGTGSVTNNGTLVFNRSDGITVGNAISGTGALTKLGAGMLTLTGNNAYSGGTTISAGTLGIGSNAALGTGTVVINGPATLAVVGPIQTIRTLSNNFTINAATIIDGTGASAGPPFGFAGNVLELNGNLTGSGSLQVIGGGALALGGNNAGYSGNLIIGGGTTTDSARLRLLSANANGTGTITLNRVAVVSNFTTDTLTINNNIIVAGEGIEAPVLTSLNTTGGLIINGNISAIGAGDLIKAGSNTLTLNGNNTFNRLFLQTGTVVAGSNTALGTGTLTTQAGTTLQLGIATSPGVSAGPITLGNRIELQGNTNVGLVGTLASVNEFNGNYSSEGTVATLNGVIEGGHRLTILGGGTLTLNGNNTYSGGTNIGQALVQVGNANAFGSGAVTLDGIAGLRNTTGGALTLGNAIAAVGPGVTIGGTSNFTLTGNLSGSGRLFKVQGNTLAINSMVNDFSGLLTVNGGTVLVNGTMGNAAASVIVNNNGTLGGSGTIAGGVTINSGGTLAAGQSAGTLRLESNLTLNTGSSTIFELAEAGVAGGANNDLIRVTGTLALNGGGIRVVRGTGFSAGQYTLFEYGTLTGAIGNMTLAALDGGFAGSLAVGTGTVLLNVAGAADQVRWNGSTLAPVGTIVGGSGTWDLVNGNFSNAAATVSGPWAGNGALAIFGGTAGGGTVTIANDTMLAPSGLTFETNGYTITGGNAGSRLDLTGPTGIETLAGVSATIAAPITGTGSITKNGDGTLVLTGANSYAGGTAILGGTLQVGNGGASGSLGTGDVLNNAALLFNRAGEIAVGGVISGSGTLTQQGTGGIILTGANTYDGLTTVAAGTLTAASNTALGSTVAGTVVSSGATLAVQGLLTIGEAITLNGAGVGGGGALRGVPVGPTGNETSELQGLITLASDATITVVDRMGLIFTGPGIQGSGTQTLTFASEGTGNSTIRALGPITDIAGLIKNGPGLLELGGVNTFTGPVTINGGDVNLTGGAALADSVAVSMSAPARLGIAASETIGSLAGSGSVLLGANRLTTGGNNASTSFAGVISGAMGGLTKVGSGTFTLSGANTYTGATRIEGGTLALGANDVISNSSAVQIAGGTLALGTFTDIVASMALSAGSITGTTGSALTVTGNYAQLGGTLAAGATVNASAPFRLDGGTIAGTLNSTAGGTNAGNVGGTSVLVTGQLLMVGDLYVGQGSTGAIAVNAGGLIRSRDGVIGSAGGTGSSATVSGAGSRWEASSAMAVGFTTAGSLLIENGGVVSSASSFVGFTEAGPGSVVVTGAGSRWENAGLMQIGARGAGTLTIADGGVVTAANVVIARDTTSTGTLIFGAAEGSAAVATGTLAAPTITLGSGAATIIFNHTAADLELAAAISGNGALRQLAGTTTLSGASTFTGTTSVLGGTLQVTGALGSDVTVLGGSLINAGNIAGAVSNAGTLTNSGTLGSTLTNAAGGTASNTGTVSGLVTNSGTLANGGTLGGGLANLAGGSASSSGSIAGAVSNAGTLTNSGSIAGLVTNSGALTSSGTLGGGLDNSGTSSLAGAVNGTVQNSGTITLTGAVTGIGAFTQTASGTFNLGGNTTQIGSLDGAGSVQLGSAALTAGSTNASTLFSGIIAGSGSLAKVGTGTLTLGGANTFTGLTTVNAGTLAMTASGGLVGAVSNNAALINAGNIAGAVSNAGTLTNSGTLGSTLTNAAGGTASNTGTVSGLVTNSGTLANGGTLGGGLANLAGGSASSSGSIAGAVSNAGTLTNSGSIAGLVTNSGALTSSGTLGGGLDNSGTSSLAGAVNGTVQNSGTITLTGAVTGIGAFTQTASGTFNLGGNTTQIGSLDGAGSVQLGSAALTAGSTNASTLFSGIIAGSGSLAKVGTGTLVLTGANTYAGPTMIAGGALQLGNGTASGSLAGGAITNNGALIISRSDSITLANAIAGTGLLVQDGTGTTRLTAANRYTGGTLVSRGRLVGDTAALQGAIQNSAVLEFAMPGNGTFAGALGGTGRVEKTGAGILTFAADGRNLTGPFAVLGGTLRMDGANGGRLDRSVVTLAAGTTLAGTGLIGGLVIEGGALVTPGNSLGVIGVTGDVTFRAASRFLAQISESGADLITAGGAARLAGTLEVVNLGAAAYRFNSTFTVLEAAGGVSGSFDTVTFAGFSPIYRPSLRTTATGVAVVLAPGSLAALAGTGLTGNLAAVAARLDAAVAGGFDPQSFFGVYSLPQAQLAAALDQLSGEIHPAMGRAAMRQSRLPREAVLERAAGVALADNPQGNSFGTWAKLMRSWGDVAAAPGTASQQTDTEGFVIGVDGGTANDTRALRFGVYGSLLNTRVAMDARGSSGEIRQTGGGVYASFAAGGFSLVAGAGAARFDISTNRTFAVPGLAGSTSSMSAGDMTQLFGRIGYRFDLGAASLEPFVAADHAWIALDPVVERGGAAALSVARQDYKVAGTTTGLALKAPLGKLRIDAEAAARFELGDRASQALIALAAAPGAATRIGAARLAGTAFTGRLGAVLPITSRIEVRLDYGGEFSSTDTEHTAQAGLAIRF